MIMYQLHNFTHRPGFVDGGIFYFCLVPELQSAKEIRRMSVSAAWRSKHTNNLFNWHIPPPTIILLKALKAARLTLFICKFPALFASV